MRDLGRFSQGYSAHFWGATLFVALAGCAQSPPVEAPPSARESSDQLPTTVVTPHESLDVLQLLERADQSLKDERFDSAVRDYKLVSETAVEQANRLRALFGWATSLDFAGVPQQALMHYSRFVEESGPSSQRNTAHARIVRLLVYLERYAEASKASQSLDLNAMNASQRVVLFAARALSALQQTDLESAEINIARGRTIIESEGLDRVGVPSTDVAALYFALGELRRLRSEKIVFEPLPSDFTQALEQRCQLILDAQSAFSEAMRSNDAHWSSMSGVRVGQLYQSLHADLMTMPRPSAANTSEKAKLFEGAIRLRYSILLRKSVSMMRATVAMLERTEEKSRWRDKAVQSLQEIEKSQQEEEAAINALPYSREQLQQVLDEMSTRARSSSPGS